MQNLDVISLAMQFTISGLTLLAEWLKGNKWPHVWKFCLGTQALWAAWIVYAQNWGLLPLTVFLTVMFWRNHRKWRAEGQTVFGKRLCGGCETQANCILHGCKNRVDTFRRPPPPPYCKGCPNNGAACDVHGCYEARRP